MNGCYEWYKFLLIFYIIRLTIVIMKISRHHPHIYCFCLKCNYDAEILNKCELWIVACCLIQGNGTTNLKALIRVFKLRTIPKPLFSLFQRLCFPESITTVFSYTQNVRNHRSMLIIVIVVESVFQKTLILPVQYEHHHHCIALL